MIVKGNMKSCNKIFVELGSDRYPVCLGVNIFSLLPGLIRSGSSSKQVAIISVPPVSLLYADQVKSVFDHTWQIHHLDVPDGERSKSAPILLKIYSWLIRHHLERNCTLLSLGGGVVGDLAGFAAASYLRGVNLIHLPTTLLAQVDSSIGGKVGINHGLGKNLIGFFYQPKAVLTDISVLKTLPEDEFVCGVGEIVKYAILNKRLFEFLEKNLSRLLRRDQNTLLTVVKRCIEIKAKIVAADEKEQGIRAVLNLGHTFGHALERFYEYKFIKHGQAVLLGLYSTLHASLMMNLIRSADLARIKNLLGQIPVYVPAGKINYNALRIVNLIRTDKKIRAGKINLILIQEIGKVVRRPVTDQHLLRRSLEIIKNIKS
jgi:3-dehydroquinate synthase